MLGRVLVAAGSGRRFGGSVNKPFLKLDDKAILLWSLEVLRTIHPSGPTVLVHRAEDHDHVRALESSLLALGVEAFMTGGERRQDSVLRGCRALSENCTHVLIHDAARPFPPLAGTQAAVDAALQHGAAFLALRARDTLRRVRSGFAVETVDRSEIVHSQTPQVFELTVLLDELERCGSETVTDEVVLFERQGRPTAVIEGDPRNIKITTSDDLIVAHALARGINRHCESERDHE